SGDADFQRAIQTTDAFEKRANLEVELPSGTVRLSAQCKGAGMISPRFATMLCFLQTDAALAAETADLLLGVCVKRSFDRTSVDGALGPGGSRPTPLAIDVAIEGVDVCSAGAAIPYDEQALARAVQREEVEYEIGLPGEGAETEVFFSDLSHEYVTINADYTT